MIVFHCDLDNTLIYSYKKELSCPVVPVERYQGRDISFMSVCSYELLPKINEKTMFVPTTTRSLEQYQRIDLGFVPQYALVCNGGVLLVDGQRDQHWYEDSLALIAPCQGQLALAQRLLASDCDVNFEVRFLENLFLFTKSAKPEETISRLVAALDTNLVSVHANGTKVYVVPKGLDKGDAVARFQVFIREKTGQSVTSVAAGDSDFDIPMLQAAQMAIAPAELVPFAQNHWTVCNGQCLYAEQLLEKVLNL